MVKHAKERGRFKNWTNEDVKTVINESIDRAIENGNVRDLDLGRTAYFDDLTGRVNILNPNPGNPSTSFIPDNPADYFHNILK